MSPQKSIKNVATTRNLFEKDNNETNEQFLRNKHIDYPKKTEEDKIDDNKIEDNKIEENEEAQSSLIENGSGDNVTPPKPLPRRTASLSESSDDPAPKPVARPRTNSIISTVVPLTTSVTTPPTYTTAIHVVTTYKVKF